MIKINVPPKVFRVRLIRVFKQQFSLKIRMIEKVYENMCNIV